MNAEVDDVVLAQPEVATDLVQNQYQLDKYIKHTTPSSSVGKTGVYTWPGSDTYKDFAVSAVASI